MNVEIGAEAALFPEKEYINGIAVAVQQSKNLYWEGQESAYPYQSSLVELLSSVISASNWPIFFLLIYDWLPREICQNLAYILAV
jgi:hypothetical protein